ncbi:thermonuclease family protein [Rhodovastum sp. RN2-1]|uniref:Thermonuclease family protein n=1 Tax=Limobrevibacterium gyesilva TaxID=2991712 RepID=A0AA41YJM7_9PROT|nr:thermonuclease family protein [Limobrevibacterium gyesilva]
MVAGVAGGLLGVAAILFALPADLFGRVPPVTGTLTAAPHQVAVVDGETLVIHETVIRLQGIVAPARGQTCHDANGAGTDCGAASAAALARLVRGHEVACRLNGRDREGFARGLCEAAGTELNRALVAAGWARARGDTADFADAEAQARNARLGLWRSGAF